MACSIYFEARGESFQSQVDVAQTMITRVIDDYYPDTMCKVVWQASQFSWTRDGKGDTIPNGPVIQGILDAVNVAINAGPNGYDHYYAHGIVNPRWARVSKCRKTKKKKGAHSFCNLYYEKNVYREGLLARDILMNLEAKNVPRPTPSPRRVLKNIPRPSPAPRDWYETQSQMDVYEMLKIQQAEAMLPEGLKEFPSEEELN